LEAFLAGLIGFLIGRGVAPKDAQAIVKALQQYLGFEPPLGLTGYALKTLEKGEESEAGVVVRGKTYPAKALEKIIKYHAVSVLGKHGSYLEIAPMVVERTQLKGYETKKFEWTGTLDPLKSHTLCELKQQHVKLQTATLGTNVNRAGLNLVSLDSEGNPEEMIKIVKRDGTGLVAPTPQNINLHKSELWELLYYDTTNNYYKFSIRRPLNFQNGLIIYIRNYSTTQTANISVEALISVEGV